MIQRSLNRTALWNIPKRNWLLKKLFGSIDGNAYLVQIPLHVSCGCNIHVGRNFNANYNCVMMDYAPITIGNDVWLGAGTIVLPGVTIGSGTTIGAGSVVTHDIPANVLACGNPCKIIRAVDT